MSNTDKVHTTSSTGLFTRYHPAQSTSSKNLLWEKWTYTTDAFVLLYWGKRCIFHVSEVLERLHLASLHSLIKTHFPNVTSCVEKLNTRQNQTGLRVRWWKTPNQMLRMCDLKCSRVLIWPIFNRLPALISLICVRQEGEDEYNLIKTFPVKCFHSSG